MQTRSLRTSSVLLLLPVWLLGCVLADAPLGAGPRTAATAEQAPADEGATDAEGAPNLAIESETSSEEFDGALVPLTRGQLWARWNALRGDPYELDAIERRLEPGQRPPCDPKTLVKLPGVDASLLRRFDGERALQGAFVTLRGGRRRGGARGLRSRAEADTSLRLLQLSPYSEPCLGRE